MGQLLCVRGDVAEKRFSACSCSPHDQVWDCCVPTSSQEARLGSKIRSLDDGGRSWPPDLASEWCGPMASDLGKTPGPPLRTVGVLRLQLQRLQAVQVLVQEQVQGVAAAHLGLGASAPTNLALRKRLGQPGAPFGGLGFLDPQKNVEEASGEAAGPNLPPCFLTQEFVRAAKLREFEQCAKGEHSMYLWALQPIYDSQDRCAACEILIRCRNGADSAPYEDVLALMNPTASQEVRRVYAQWKAAEVVDWSLSVLKAHPALRSLTGLASNLRPLDLCPKGDVFREVKRRLQSLSAEDRALLLGLLVIEVTEDQRPPEDLASVLGTWEDLGFRLACDDIIGDRACEALGKRGQNFHTVTAVRPFLRHFKWMKVDIDWAGFMLFLSHPSYNNRDEVKREVLRKAMEEDLVYVPEGTKLRSTGFKHSELLWEFAAWAQDMLAHNKHIYIELSVSPKDESNKYALDKLKAMGLDLFGDQQAHFRFQGGPTGPKAFEPRSLAQGAEVIFHG